MEKITEGVLSYTETTNDICISVNPQFLPEESDPLARVYAFAYTVTVENFGSVTVQLLRRHWIVMSGGVQIAEVNGDGVIGEQPILPPEHAFQYTSGSVINDPVGSMHGSYTFKGEGDYLFQVVIPKFDLLYPTLLH